MKSTVTKIEIITEKGTFTFSTYEALLDFEKSNYKQLGETSYNVFREYEDGDIIEMLHEGINAGGFLSEDVNED